MLLQLQNSQEVLSNLAVIFDEGTSNALGHHCLNTNNNNNLIISPLSFTTEDGHPPYTNKIRFRDQQPYFTVKIRPKMIHVLTDIVMNESHYRNLWTD